MNDVKICSICKTTSSKCNFNKDITKEDGYRPSCKICCQKYYYDNQNKILNDHKSYNKKNRSKINAYERQKKKTDIDYKLAHNIRSRTRQAFKSQNIRKTNRIFDLLGCSPEFFKNWILYQLHGDMTLENYG